MMKQWKIIMSAIVVAVIANTSMAGEKSVKLPSGWMPHGSLGSLYWTGFSAPDSTECGTSCFMLVGIQDEAHQKPGAFAAITKMVDVSQFQDHEFSLSLKYSQDGRLENKDVWLRFFDEKGEIAKLRVPLLESANDAFASTQMNFLVPRHAQKMEMGFGLSGFGRLEFGDLKLTPIQQRESLINHIANTSNTSITSNTLNESILALRVDR